MEMSRKHQQKYENELKVGSIKSYPLGMYEFECQKCRESFKCWEDNIDHMSKIHLSEAQHQGAVVSKVHKSNEKKDTEKKKYSDIKCKNGKIAQ